MSASLLLALAATAAAIPPAPPALEPASLVLIVASNRGVLPGRQPLMYADDDGAKYHEVFSAIAGPDRTILLADFDRDTARLFPALLDKIRSPSRAQLDLAVERLARQAAEMRREGRAVRFHFVFAGHGDVDGGRGFLELADGPLTADDLLQLLRTIDATESHVILDSCNSFFVVNPRRTGGARNPIPRDAADALARRLPNVGVFLSTSSQAEVFEWSELQSGIFSHAVRSGLLGAADADGNGRVSYDELGAFVETASAAIRNPRYRPKVFARGPNGEDGRTLLDLPRSRVALVVDEPEPIRLAVKDADGVRWLDAHAEAGSPLRLWFPPSLTGRLEVERLAVRRDGVRIDARLRLPPTEPPARLAALLPSPGAIAERGPGEIFQALFALPFGPVAVDGYLAGRLGRLEELLGMEPPPPLPREPAEVCLDAPRPPPGWSDPGHRVYAQVRIGGLVPSLSSSGRLSLAREITVSPSGALGVGVELGPYLAAEVEAGYQRLTATSDFFSYPNPAFTYTPVSGTRVVMDALPLSAALRIQVPRFRPSPYLEVGGGGAFLWTTLDPSDANATLRARSFVTLLRAAVGLQVDLGERAFLGVDARWVRLSDVRLYDSTLGISGLGVGAVIGVRR